jgi:hypothetical protein
MLGGTQLDHIVHGINSTWRYGTSSNRRNSTVMMEAAGAAMTVKKPAQKSGAHKMW